MTKGRNYRKKSYDGETLVNGVGSRQGRPWEGIIADEGKYSVLNLRIEDHQLCQDEIKDFLLDLIKEELKKTDSDPNLRETRKYHVLASILKLNHKTGVKDKVELELKEVLRQTQTMDQKTRRRLKELGFAIIDKGAHYKLVYQDDERYTFTVSRTPSDRRAYLNSFQTAALKIF